MRERGRGRELHRALEHGRRFERVAGLELHHAEVNQRLDHVRARLPRRVEVGHRRSAEPLFSIEETSNEVRVGVVPVARRAGLAEPVENRLERILRELARCAR